MSSVPIPTIVFQGKTVFKEAENRTRMCLGGPGDNSDVLGHVFPGEAISLGSDPELLQIAQNTVAALNPEDGQSLVVPGQQLPQDLHPGGALGLSRGEGDRSR